MQVAACYFSLSGFYALVLGFPARWRARRALRAPAWGPSGPDTIARHAGERPSGPRYRYRALRACTSVALRATFLYLLRRHFLAVGNLLRDFEWPFRL